MMPPHEYVHYVTQGRLMVLERRLEARKIAAVVMGNVLVLALLLAPRVDPGAALIFYGLIVGAGLHLVWCLVVAWRLSRKIRRLKEGAQ